MVTLVGRYNAASCRQSVITCLFNLRNPSSTGSLHLGHPELRTKMSFLLAPFYLPVPLFSPRFFSCLCRGGRGGGFSCGRHSQSSPLLSSPLGGQVMDDLGPRRVLMQQRFHASRTLVKHGLAAFFTHRPRTVAQAQDRCRFIYRRVWRIIVFFFFFLLSKEKEPRQDP